MIESGWWWWRLTAGWDVLWESTTTSVYQRPSRHKQNLPPKLRSAKPTCPEISLKIIFTEIWTTYKVFFPLQPLHSLLNLISLWPLFTQFIAHFHIVNRCSFIGRRKSIIIANCVRKQSWIPSRIPLPLSYLIIISNTLHTHTFITASWCFDYILINLLIYVFRPRRSVYYSNYEWYTDLRVIWFNSSESGIWSLTISDVISLK